MKLMCIWRNTLLLSAVGALVLAGALLISGSQRQRPLFANSYHITRLPIMSGWDLTQPFGRSPAMWTYFDYDRNFIVVLLQDGCDRSRFGGDRPALTIERTSYDHALFNYHTDCEVAVLGGHDQLVIVRSKDKKKESFQIPAGTALRWHTALVDELNSSDRDIDDLISERFTGDARATALSFLESH
jgi:hypothetical protein